MNNHYVYLYRDKSGKPRYVGYGENSLRATSHLAGSHNDSLNEFLDEAAFSLEIAGPFETEATGRAVETALISSLNPDLNRDLGQARWRFRPIGVPQQFAERLLLPPLEKVELCRDEAGNPHQVLLVKIGDKNFEDGRVGYNPANPPSDEQILERMDRWWQLVKSLPQWSALPSESPSVLIGVNGKPGSQIVIGAVFIDQLRWNETEQDGSFVAVPTRGPEDLDALALRGRRIAKEVGLRFNAFHSGIYVLMEPDTVEPQSSDSPL